MHSKALLDAAAASLLTALAPADGCAPPNLYQLYYEQRASKTSAAAPLSGQGPIIDLPTPSVSLTFDDAILDPVQQVWRKAMGDAVDGEHLQYMVFADREGQNDEEDDDLA